MCGVGRGGGGVVFAWNGITYTTQNTHRWASYNWNRNISSEIYSITMQTRIYIYYEWILNSEFGYCSGKLIRSYAYKTVYNHWRRGNDYLLHHIDQCGAFVCVLRAQCTSWPDSELISVFGPKVSMQYSMPDERIHNVICCNRHKCAWNNIMLIIAIAKTHTASNRIHVNIPYHSFTTAIIHWLMSIFTATTATHTLHIARASLSHTLNVQLMNLYKWFSITHSCLFFQFMFRAEDNLCFLLCMNRQRWWRMSIELVRHLVTISCSPQWLLLLFVRFRTQCPAIGYAYGMPSNCTTKFRTM